MLRPILKCLTLGTFILLQQNVFASECITPTCEEEDKILQLVANLPAELIARVQDGTATEDDLQILIDLGKNEQSAITKSFSLINLIFRYLNQKQQIKIEPNGSVDNV